MSNRGEITITIKHLHTSKKPCQDTVITYQIFINSGGYDKVSYDNFRHVLQSLILLQEGRIIKWSDDISLVQSDPYLSVYRPSVADTQERRVTVTIPNFE